MELPILRKSIEAKISDAKLEIRPFPHLIIENFFPEEVYTQVQKFNLFKRNDGEMWMTKKGMMLNRNSTPYDHRMQINFHKNDAYEASAEEKEFWDIMKDTFLMDNWFPKLIRNKFSDYFEIRFGEALDQDSFWSSMRKELFLQRHEVGYHIGPHTDISTRVFTCIFSFAEREGFDEFGTQLLRHKDSKVRCWGDLHYDFKNYELVKMAPYRPNNFLLFFKTRHSFHAVRDITKDVPNERFGMQFQYYEPSGGYFNDLSRPDLMQIGTDNFYGRMYKKLKKLKA